MRNRIDHAYVRKLATSVNPATGRAHSKTEIAAIVKCHPAYVRGIINGRLTLKSERRAKAKVDRATLARIDLDSLHGKFAGRMLPFNAEPIVKGRTVYPATVHEPEPGRPVLKSGYNSSKIGKFIIKGAWAGFPIYTLTLEERATCPATCEHWRSCYGGSMQLAERLMHGPALERALELEIGRLAEIHKDGFAVRLHVLGDFYSVEYVKLWAGLIEKHPELHVFGFTARWHAGKDPIARELVDLVMRRWDRFAIRFSDAPIDECSTVSIEYPGNKPDDAIICPQQLGQTQTCGACALCWQSKKRIAFIHH